MKKNATLFLMTWFISFQVFGQPFHSNHFTIQKLSDGVFAAIANNGDHAICNAGIIDLGDATLVFDPFMTPEAAWDLKTVAQELTGHPVKYVVNSHFHNDHIGGNQVFPEAAIISTQRTRELIAEIQPEETAYYKKSAPVKLEKINAENISAMSPHQIDEHIMWKGYYEALVTSLDSLQMVLPGITFTNELWIHGATRSLQLLCYGEGHTESDLFLFLPVEHIAFLGDLLFIQNHPWIDDGDTKLWTTYLDRIALLQPDQIVPGHGPVGNLSSIAEMKSYFEKVIETATTCHQKGIQPENENFTPCPSPYDTWFLSIFYKPNVISAYHSMYGK